MCINKDKQANQQTKTIWINPASLFHTESLIHEHSQIQLNLNHAVFIFLSLASVKSIPMYMSHIMFLPTILLLRTFQGWFWTLGPRGIPGGIILIIGLWMNRYGAGRRLLIPFSMWTLSGEGIQASASMEGNSFSDNEQRRTILCQEKLRKDLEEFEESNYSAASSLLFPNGCSKLHVKNPAKFW